MSQRDHNWPSFGALLERERRHLLWGVTAVGFWIAIILPFVYLPLMVTGLDSMAEWKAFGLLLTLHIVTLIIGQWHT